jgi:predicted GIY-YIG superfamily endonuclease
MGNCCVCIIDKRGKQYVGITTDMEYRMRRHGAVKLLYQERPADDSEASKRERILKGWSGEKKLKLIREWPGKPEGLTHDETNDFSLGNLPCLSGC